MMEKLSKKIIKVNFGQKIPSPEFKDQELIVGGKLYFKSSDGKITWNFDSNRSSLEEEMSQKYPSWFWPSLIIFPFQFLISMKLRQSWKNQCQKT